MHPGQGIIAAPARVVALIGLIALGAAAPPEPRAGPAGEIAVGQQLRPLVEDDWIRQDRLFSLHADEAPIVASDTSGQVTTRQDAAGGCDGIKGRFGFHTASGEQDPWWQVDLGRPRPLDRVVIYNRTDCPPDRTKNIRLLVSVDPDRDAFQLVYQHDGEPFFGGKENRPLVVDLRDRPVTARFVRLLVPGRCSFALEEVEVFGVDDPSRNIALGRPADQKSVSPYSRPGTKGVQRPAPEEPLPEEPVQAEFRLAHTRRVIERGRALVDRLRPDVDPASLAPLAASLDELDRRLLEFQRAGAASEAVRREQYFEARRLTRRVALLNPRLDFERILFIKRHDPGGLYHMVHQYYGFGAVPGGGLFVLVDPFSDQPKVVDLLADSVVENGRLKGKRLESGSFLSPEVSFDGRSILFAYTEAKGEKPEWSPRSCYHLFRVNADGRRLRQLTDGPWNDFDPCFLPNGRIVFVSERRGGYLRCGGSAPPWDSPTYTLHSMAADGGDVVCLSFHETQEWHPSLDHNGMLLYTRWDYVDRDTNIAHHLWSCYPDGRDPRSFHGNYPRRRESRPWMEMSARAVPGSNRFVATAAAHHGHAFGSLVLIDYRVEDDGGTSQIERLTPDVPFPESEGGKSRIRQRMAYGTAWPLSEDDYLCVYDAQAANRGLYWIDRFGNRELLYRDPAISCLSPIPLRSRPRPPALPERTTQTAPARLAAGQNDPATISLINVYDADLAWPDDTRITALRIIQILPKTTPPVDQPRIGAATETNARAVLGTVPVERDGSAHFEAPVGKLIYFQALDDRGMAVQSMRSGAYVHPGERLVCQGCHERKHDAPNAPRTIPLAMRRGPSRIQRECDGSNPFNYPRLVQPVLDRHCVQCHREREAVDLSGRPDAEHGWTRSYAALAPSYGFYFHVSNGSINSGVHGGSRTTPGAFGARAARLMNYLDERHHGVRLPADELRAVTLWLDCNSEFYGAYHDAEAQARGRVVSPTLD